MRSFMAMPKWRMFVFGGTGRVEGGGDAYGGGGGGGAEQPLNDLLMVDTASFRVTKPEVEGTPPAPRADMEFVFDPKHGNLVRAGGGSALFFVFS